MTDALSDREQLRDEGGVAARAADASPGSRPTDQAHDTFWSKVGVGQPDDCWPWQRSLRQGYGVYWSGQRNVAAHRFAVEITQGPIPAGLVVDHTCRNRACVNPSHLRIVDRRTNVHENSEAVAHLKSLQTHCVRGHPLSGENLVIDRGRRRCRECKKRQARDLRTRRREEVSHD